MTKFLKNNFYYLIIIFFLIINFNLFEKIYIIYLNDYDERLISAYGSCDREGYGFVKKNINNKIIQSTFFVKNSEDYPTIKGLFYKLNYYEKTKNQNFLFLINQKKESLNEDYLAEYRILKNEDNCYLLKKND